MTGSPPPPRPSEPATSSANVAIRGHSVPRVWTQPARELTPDTSYGWDVIRFAAEVLGLDLDEWQRWLLVHALELTPDGRHRFRRVVVIVARQNGKTVVLLILLAYWLFVDVVAISLLISAKLEYAIHALGLLQKLCEAAAALDADRPRGWRRRSNGQVRLTACVDQADAEVWTAAANGNAGRSLTAHRVGMDELRTQRTYDTWDAASNSMSAVADAQLWAFSNAGTEDSIVLNDLRSAAVEGTDPELGLFEWSAAPNAATDDPAALAAANPNAGGRIRAGALLVEARAAIAAGGAKLAGFRTEKLCITIPTLNPAIDPAGWADCRWDGDLARLRDRLALLFDVAPDGQHATLLAAATLPDGRTAVEAVHAWAGVGAPDRMRRELPALVRRVRPRVLGWLPDGPAAEFAADMAQRPGWPPRGVLLEAVRGEVPAACMAFASLVAARRILQPGDPLLDAQSAAAEKLPIGDRWVFSRRGKGHVDAIYAAAGAVQLARQLPPPKGRPRVVIVNPEE